VLAAKATKAAPNRAKAWMVVLVERKSFSATQGVDTMKIAATRANIAATTAMASAPFGLFRQKNRLLMTMEATADMVIKICHDNPGLLLPAGTSVTQHAPANAGDAINVINVVKTIMFFIFCSFIYLFCCENGLIQSGLSERELYPRQFKHKHLNKSI
jgi:hypothetical protein